MNTNTKTDKQSVRSQLVARRTYSRPKEGGGFESWDEVCERVVGHQRWLWQRALGDKPLSLPQEAELDELRQLLRSRKASVSGRTLWLGGTNVAKTREASQFNCSFTKVETVHDVVDAFWLLLQGCFIPGTVVKMADGTRKPIEQIVPGDKIMSYDENAGAFRPSVVTKLNENMPKPLVRVKLQDGTDVVCTEDHQFMTEVGWVKAKDLAGLEIVQDVPR